MSTRSVVGALGEDGHLHGRYVHFDGYPSGVGLEVWNIVKRDGPEVAVKTILSYQGWSCLDSAMPPDSARGLIAVAGYGEAYERTPGWVEDQNEADQEYGYAIGPDGLTAWASGHKIGTWAWDGPAPDWR